MKGVKKKIIIICIFLIPIIILWFLISPIIKFLLNERLNVEYNPYKENTVIFNEIIQKVNSTKPINNVWTQNRYYFSLDINSKYEYSSEDKRIILDYMKAYGIKTIFHWEDGTIDIRMNKFILWNIDYMYVFIPDNFSDKNKYNRKKIIEKLDKNWIIYSPYKFE